MNKLNVVIIEDEIPSARLLSSIIRRLRPDWHCVVLQGNVDEAVKWFRINPHPELLFLDIQLSDGNSFDFLAQAKPSSTIIFTTAYDEYALRAFSVNSIDYILKPVDEKRLLEAIIKYETLISKHNREQDEYLNTILDSLQSKEKRFRTRFLISSADTFLTLQLSDIAYFYSDNKITFAVTHSGKEYVINLPLDRLSEQLEPDQFFRANRQILLCINSIKKIEPYFNDKIIVSVQPNYKDKITISKEKIPLFKLWLNF